MLVAVVLLSNKYKVNPDNMATPLAASIGDVVSISMLSFITSILFANLGNYLTMCRWNYFLMILLVRHPSVDYLHSDWNLLLAATVMVYFSITKSLYQTSFKKWMDPGVISIVHQRVKQNFKIIDHEHKYCFF